jgi:hypothetical protein
VNSGMKRPGKGTRSSNTRCTHRPTRRSASRSGTQRPAAAAAGPDRPHATARGPDFCIPSTNIQPHPINRHATGRTRS